MTAAPEQKEYEGDGCLFIIGAIMVALAIGHIFREAYGWLFLGALLIACAISSTRRRA